MLFRLSEIYKSYSAREILRGTSFQINPSEKVGLVGRNGAGKTTIFRLITGEESPDDGEIIKINGLKLGLLAQHIDFAENETVHTAALSAFQKLHDIEAEMRRLELRMAEDMSDDVMERYAELQNQFESEDGYTFTARAEAILLGLGFPRESWEMNTGNLSGGQKNRLGLARLLLSGADILLLDEPTNHLDVNAVEWLENFLQTYEKTFVLISHDRYFLDRVCNRIIEVENGKAISYKGNYSQFLTEREERREAQRRAFENQQTMIAKNEDFIRRNLAGQKTKLAKSRRTMLERLERVEAVAADKSQGNFKLKKGERAGNQVLTVEDLTIGYDENILAEGITLSLLRGECLGVIGGNGTGKTTFLKTTLGTIREISGKLIWGAKTDIGYYSQQLEELDDRNEIIQELRRVAPSAENGALRSFLARFLFVGEDIFKQVSTLSGGEKGRLSLAKLIYSNKNVLVLDEPTNHLDIPSREALEAALDAFDGTIITVSHDRFFLDRIATQILSFEDNKEVLLFDGNYTQFHDWKFENERAKRNEPEITANENIRNDTKGVFKKSTGDRGSLKIDNLSKNQRIQLEKRVAEIETETPQLESRIANLTSDIGMPEIAGDREKITETSKRIDEIQSKLQALYREWEELSSKL